MKRTKGGLLPWWVRKRLQEHSEPDQKGTSTVLTQPVKARRKTPNILEVGETMLAGFPLTSVTQSCSPFIANCGEVIEKAESGLCMSRWYS